ncbi:type IX secretion system membrane protein PorP/SprF [Maribacter sp.]|uniref:type IX secretion system membrane protein PorP/SprF n=1 Tax=Maribacter sp. TaxID=1897614 RepID=UPI0025C527D2|nr:type IX secretion system membrane protein PorP/SprF [Maribacter sp.]
METIELIKFLHYYIILSTPGVLSNDRYEKDGAAPISVSDYLVVFAGGGYDFDLSNRLQLRPSVLSRFVSGAPLSIDLTGSLLYDDKFELGTNL